MTQDRFALQIAALPVDKLISLSALVEYTLKIERKCETYVKEIKTERGKAWGDNIFVAIYKNIFNLLFPKKAKERIEAIENRLADEKSKYTCLGISDLMKMEKEMSRYKVVPKEVVQDDEYHQFEIIKHLRKLQEAIDVEMKNRAESYVS